MSRDTLAEARGDARGYTLVLLAAAGWSTSGLFIRLAASSGGLSAIPLAFVRDLSTFLVLLVGLALLRPRWLRVEERDLPLFVGLGAIGVGAFHILWNLTILNLGYATATTLIYFSPSFVTLMAWLLWREPLTRAKILAVVLTLAGCVLVAGLGAIKLIDVTAGGLILGLITAMVFGAFTLFGRPLAGRYSPWTILTYAFGIGALVQLPLQFLAPAPAWPLPAMTWAWVAGLVLISTVGPFAAYLASLSRLPASVASILSSSEVLFGALVGTIFFEEGLRSWQILGAVLVVAGVAIIATRDGG
ncbi:DMT family transporter [Chloroflexota bacterium]